MRRADIDEKRRGPNASISAEATSGLAMAPRAKKNIRAAAKLDALFIAGKIMGVGGRTEKIGKVVVPNITVEA